MELPKSEVLHALRRALREDVGPGDFTTLAVVPLRGPLLLRLPEGPPIEDPLAIRAIDVCALFPEILAGEIRTTGQAQAWLAARGVASRMAP